MTRILKSTCAVSIAALVTAGPAVADITSEDVWTNWRSYLEGTGLSVSAEESIGSRQISLRNMTLVYEMPDGLGTISIIMPEIDFEDRGDGSVNVSYPATSELEVLIEPTDDSPGRLVLGLDSQGLTIVASGEPDDITYLYSAAEMSLSLDEFTIEDEELPEIIFQTSLAGVTGQSNVAISDMFRVSERFDSRSVSFDMRIIDPENDENIVMTGTTEGMAFELAADMPLETDPNDVLALFDAGFTLDALFERGATQSLVTGFDDDGPFSVESSNAGGSAEFMLDKDRLDILAESSDIAFTVLGGDIPFPFSGQIGETAFNMTMPLSADETPQKFALGATLADVMVPDLLWNIFDPSAILERGPATLDFDLAGTTRLFTALFDPALTEADDFPGELTSLQLNDLNVSMAGAELTGSGAFTFDNSDMESFEGFPRPEGAADFRLLGGNQLLDNLIAMGAIEPQEAMGARMMMGVVAVAGPGDDELKSRVEVNEDGHVLANGQRLR